ncbi:hypothetical protein LINPERPRIM_LOCUS14973 [Linum perenne]
MFAGILKENDVIDDGINFDKGARTVFSFVTLKVDGDREFMFFRNPQRRHAPPAQGVQPRAHHIC